MFEEDTSNEMTPLPTPQSVDKRLVSIPLHFGTGETRWEMRHFGPPMQDAAQMPLWGTNVELDSLFYTDIFAHASPVKA